MGDDGNYVPALPNDSILDTKMQEFLQGDGDWRLSWFPARQHGTMDTIQTLESKRPRLTKYQLHDCWSFASSVQVALLHRCLLALLAGSDEMAGVKHLTQGLTRPGHSTNRHSLSLFFSLFSL